MIDDPTITHHLAAIVANYFDPRFGWRASTGELAYIEAAAMGDDRLLSKLALGFPGLVEAVRKARSEGAEALMAVDA